MNETTISLSGDWQGDRPPLQKWGPFDLKERVGQGGFGEVYRAFDPALQREVAVKLLHPRTDGGELQTEAILRESRAMARVSHTNVVPIYGVQSYDGRVGFWSGFVRGKTLSGILDENGPFGPAEVVHIGIDLCRALSAVHAAGLLHRDIKAGNAMREEGGRILLMDFGLTQERDGQTHFGGTPGYITPEFRTGGKATIRSDIYALGVLLYHLLTGKYPAAEPGATWNLLEERPDLPPGLVRAIHIAIDPDPEKRFATAAQMAAALDIENGLTPAPQAEERGSRARPYSIIAAALLVAAAGYQFRSLWLPGAGSTTSIDLQKRYDKAHEMVQHYYRPGALNTVIPILEAITKDDPSFAPALADLGRANYLQFVSLRDKRYAEPARKASLGAVAVNPNQASAHVTLGLLDTQLGNNGPAAQELDRALAIDRSDAEVFGARAELYQRQGRNEDVEPALKRAVDLDPKDWRWPKQLAEYYDRVGRHDEAIQNDQKALLLAPDNARALNNLGLHLSSMGRLEEARTALQAAIKIEPNYNRYSNLGLVELDLGNYAAAVELFQKAIALNPGDYRAWDSLGAAYRRGTAEPVRWRETYDKAIMLGEELLKTEPKNTAVLSDVGIMYAEIGDFEKALPLVRQAAALEPENGELQLSVGAVYELMQNRAEAIVWVQTALRRGYPRQSVERAWNMKQLTKDKKYLAIAAAPR